VALWSLQRPKSRRSASKSADKLDERDPIARQALEDEAQERLAVGADPATLEEKDGPDSA